MKPDGTTGLLLKLLAIHRSTGLTAVALASLALVAGCGDGAQQPTQNASAVVALPTNVAPGAPAKPVGSPAPIAAPVQKPVGLERVPFQLGWYVDKDTDCAKATTAMKFEPDGFWEVGADGNTPDDPNRTFHQDVDVGSLSRDGEQYFFSFTEPKGGCEKDDDACPGGVYIVPRGRTHIDWGIQGDASSHYCPAAQVPKAITRQVKQGAM